MIQQITESGFLRKSIVLIGGGGGIQKTFLNLRNLTFFFWGRGGKVQQLFDSSQHFLISSVDYAAPSLDEKVLELQGLF